MDTVSIETKNGPVRINHSDYKPDEHKLTDPQPEWSALFGSAAPSVPPAPPAPPANVETPSPAPTTPVPTPPAAPPTPPAPPANVETPPVEMFVVKNENKWQITDNAGKPIDGMNGPDGAGYDTKKAAEEAKTATK